MAFTTMFALICAGSIQPAITTTFPELAATSGHFRGHKIDLSLSGIVLYSQGDLPQGDVLSAASAKLTSKGEERWVVPTLEHDLAPSMLATSETRSARQRAEAFLDRWQRARETETGQPEVMARELKLALATELVEGLLNAFTADRLAAGWYSEEPMGSEQMMPPKGLRAIEEFRAVVEDVKALYRPQEKDAKLPRYKQLKHLLEERQRIVIYVSTGWDGSTFLTAYGFGEAGDLQFFEYGRRNLQWPKGESWAEIAKGSSPMEIGSIRDRLIAGEPAPLIGLEAAIKSCFGGASYVACVGDEMAFMVDAAIEDGQAFGQRFAPMLDRSRYLRTGSVVRPAGLRQTPLVQANRAILRDWQKKAVEGQTSPYFAIDSIYESLPAHGKPYAFIYYHRSGRMFEQAGLPFPRIEAGAPSAASMGFLSALRSEGLTARLDDGHTFQTAASNRLAAEIARWYGSAGQSVPGLTIDRLPTRVTYLGLTVDGRPTTDIRLSITEPDRASTGARELEDVANLFKEVPNATPERWRAAQFRFVTTRVDKIRVMEGDREFLATDVPHAPQTGPVIEFDKLPVEWRKALTRGG